MDVSRRYVGERRHGFCGELVLKITFYKFYQVEVHQAAVEGTLGLDVTELTLLFLGTEKEVEAVALVEGKVALLVVGIDEEEATAGFVEWVNKPCLDETEHVAAEVLALEIDIDAKTANYYGWIAAILLFTRDVLLDLLLARAGNFLDAVIGKGECRHDGRGVGIEGETVILAKQLVALQECVVGEEFIQVFITATEGMTGVSFLTVVKTETALFL